MIHISEKQLQKKFKHAPHFGVGGNYSPENARKFQSAIENHLLDSDTLTITGKYHGIHVTHYVNPRTRLNVITDSSNRFISGWRLSLKQLGHVISTGNLGG